jgi:MGT family glycosyltransferase
VVTLRTLAGEVETLRSQGIATRPVAAEVEAIEHSDWRARSPLGGTRRTAKTFMARAEHEVPDLRQAIEEELPDALLVDIASWGALGAAEAWGGPWASFCPFPLALPSRDVPPYGPGLKPAHGPLGRARDRLLQTLVHMPIDHSLRPGLNALRATLGLRPLTRALEMLLQPPLLLYMTSEAFDYPRSDWPASVAMVGPSVWDPPAELPAELDGVEASLILVTTSSEFQDDGRLVRTALEALAEEPFHVVATLPTATIERLRPPPNATLLPFVPHAPILARSACAITHGGMGATQKALARGVPVCAVPFGRDQFEVARRVEVAGAGARLPAWPPFRLRPDRLRQKVRDAIACRQGAERVAREFASIDGPGVAADAIEQQLLRR